MVERRTGEERHHELRQRQSDVEQAHVLCAARAVGQRVAGEGPVDRVVEAVANAVRGTRREDDGQRGGEEQHEHEGDESLEAAAREDEDLASLRAVGDVAACEPEGDRHQQHHEEPFRGERRRIADVSHVAEEVVQVVRDRRDARGHEEAGEDDPREIAAEHGFEEVVDGLAWGLVHKPPREAIYDFFKPMLGGDFAWVIFTRFFVSAGITAVAYYLNNFFRDVTGVGDPATFTSEWFLVVLLVAIPFGLAGGYVSDRTRRRKIFVFTSGGFQAFVALVFVLFFPTSLPVVFAAGAAYGVGYGLYYAVDWALACDTLPDRTSSAKDMGLFHIALTLPQFVVPFFAGPALDHFNAVSPNLGYRVVFSSAIVFLAIGTVFVSRIRSVR